jgi:hypothetical protein
MCSGGAQFQVSVGARVDAAPRVHAGGGGASRRRAPSSFVHFRRRPQSNLAGRSGLFARPAARGQRAGGPIGRAAGGLFNYGAPADRKPSGASQPSGSNQMTLEKYNKFGPVRAGHTTGPARSSWCAGRPSWAPAARQHGPPTDVLSVRPASSAQKRISANNNYYYYRRHYYFHCYNHQQGEMGTHARTRSRNWRHTSSRPVQGCRHSGAGALFGWRAQPDEARPSRTSQAGPASFGGSKLNGLSGRRRRQRRLGMRAANLERSAGPFGRGRRAAGRPTSSSALSALENAGVFNSFKRCRRFLANNTMRAQPPAAGGKSPRVRSSEMADRGRRTTDKRHRLRAQLGGGERASRTHVWRH